MSSMTVRDLIEALEELPPDYPVATDGAEITEIVVRDEMYYTEDGLYNEGIVVKLY